MIFSRIALYFPFLRAIFTHNPIKASLGGYHP